MKAFTITVSAASLLFAGCLFLTGCSQSSTAGDKMGMAEDQMSTMDRSQMAQHGMMADGMMADGKMADGKMADGKMADGKMADGKMADGKMADGKMDRMTSK